MAEDRTRYVAMVTFKDGEELHIEGKSVLDRVKERGADVISHDALEITRLGGGLYRLDIRLDKMTEGTHFKFARDTCMPIMHVDRPDLEPDALWAGTPYYVLLGNGEEHELWTCDRDALGTRREGVWKSRPVTLLSVDPETGEESVATSESVYLTEDVDGVAVEHTLGEAGLDPEKLISFYDTERQQPLMFRELLVSLTMLSASLDVAVQARATRNKELPRQDTITPHRQYDPDTKAANLMTEAAMFTEAGALLDVAGAGERKRNKSVDVAVSFSVDEGVELSRDISAYDREVHRAISSRWVAGNRNVTATQIASDMGMPKPTPKQIRRVEESIELQRRIIGNIDFSAEARGRKLLFPDGTPVDEFIVDGHLLDMEGITLRAANGREVRGYRLDKAPLLFRHAAAVGQVISYPQRWLEFGEGSATDKNMLLRSQLLRQVSRITNPKWKKSNNIRFTTDPNHKDRPCLFSRAGINQKDRRARKEATDYVISVLDDLKRDGAIKGYTLNQQTTRGGKKSTYGVTIKP